MLVRALFSKSFSHRILQDRKNQTHPARLISRAFQPVGLASKQPVRLIGTFPDYLPPIRPQLPGATASVAELLWARHRKKLFLGAAVVVPLLLLDFSTASWIICGSGALIGSIFGIVWYRMRAGTKKLHVLLPTLEESILSKRRLVASYIGDFEIAPPSKVNCRVHQENTPVGIRNIAVFVFELRGNRGSGLVQAKFVQSRPLRGASSDLQAATTAPPSIHQQLCKNFDDVAAHKEQLLGVDLPRAEHGEETPTWILVSCFADFLDLKDIREGHISFLKREESFEYWDVEAKALVRETVPPNPFEERPDSTER